MPHFDGLAPFFLHVIFLVARAPTVERNIDRLARRHATKYKSFFVLSTICIKYIGQNFVFTLGNIFVLHLNSLLPPPLVRLPARVCAAFFCKLYALAIIADCINFV